MATCKICGQEFDASYFLEDVKQQMETHSMCFHCNFWRDRLEEDSQLPPYTACMIDGTHYIIGDPKSHFRGFGGASFQIEFVDGHKVVTTNLWCQGKPEHIYWQKKLPDNAKFENNLDK